MDIAGARGGALRRRATVGARVTNGGRAFARAVRAAALAAVATVPLGAGALAARAFARAHPAALTPDFAQPLPVVTAWGAYGGVAFAILAAAVLAACIAGVLVVRRLAAAADGRDLAALLVAAALGLAVAGAWPFAFSSDVYAYAAYGDLAERGRDPYVPAPAALHDPLLDAARWQWSGAFPVDVYGPVTLGVARAAVRLTAGSGVAATLTLLRVAAAAAFLASIALAHVALADAGRRERFVALATYALDPVLLWSVAEGHNDALLACALAAGAALARRGGPAAGALLVGASAAIKAPGAAVALAVAARALLARERRGRVPALAALGGLAVAAVVAVPPLLRALATVRVHGQYAPQVSPQGLLGMPLALALAAGATALGLHGLRRGSRRGAAWLGIALVLALPNVYPWYALWLVPWAMAAGGGAAALALRLATICTLVRYLPDAAGTLPAAAATVAALAVTLPLALSFAEFEPVRRLKKVRSTS